MKNIVSAAAVLALASGAAFAKEPAHAGHAAAHATTHTTAGAHSTAGAHGAKPTRVVMTCPVMGSKIASPAVASGYSDYKGTRYYFCCKPCKPQFDKNPASYVAKMNHAH